MRKFLIVSGLIICLVLYGCSGQARLKDEPGTEIEDVPVIWQMPNLPTGCEATAAAMLLQWAGADVTKEDVANALAKGPVPQLRGGELYGPNPNRVFIGDPFSSSGYGVFHKPIADVLSVYLGNKVYDATGTSFTNLLGILDSGRPVIVWATVNMAEPKTSKTWYDEYGNKVTWKTPEHALLLVGYTEESVIVNDPYTGSKKQYPKSAFEDNWNVMGRQAVTVEGLPA
jgi:Uncharacterized protein conserved in bacteria